MTQTHRIYPGDAAVIEKVLSALNGLDSYLEGETSYYITTPEIRIYNFDGYSPGFVTQEDGMWVFIANYTEEMM